MTIHRQEVPRHCNDGAKWNSLIERYPELSQRERAPLDYHIEQQHCSTCKSARDQLIRATEALKNSAPSIERALDWQITMEAIAAKDRVKEKVMTHWDKVTANSAADQRPTPLPVAHAAFTSAHKRHTNPPPLAELQPGFARRTGATRIWHVSAYILQPLLRLLAYLVNVTTRVSRDALLLCGALRLLGLAPSNWRPISSRRFMVVMPLALISGSVITGCALATIFLRMMLIHGPVRWWNLAMVTGLTTAAACVLLAAGVLFASNCLLQGFGWDLSKLGRLLFAPHPGSNADPKQVEEMVSATLQLFLSSAGIDDFDTAFTLTHKVQQRANGARQGDPLADRMALFDLLTQDLPQEPSSGMRQLSWQDFLQAWAAAFRPKIIRTSARNRPSRTGQGSDSNVVRSLRADCIIQAFQCVVDAGRDPDIACKLLPPTATTPAALVCVTRTMYDAPDVTTAPTSMPDERERIGGDSLTRPGGKAQRARASLKRWPVVSL